MSSSSQSNALGVLVVNYGSSDLLSSNLLALPAWARIYVGDNYYSSAERELITNLAEHRGWNLIKFDSNLGFGAANNRLAEEAIADGCATLLLLNPDARVSSASLDLIMRRLVIQPAAMVAPLIRDASGNVWFQGAIIDFSNGRAYHSNKLLLSESDWLSAACLALSASSWQRVGGFDEDYFLYWEDVDLTHRWKSMGGSLVLEPAATAFHSVGGTQKSNGPSAVKHYYSARNRLRFARLNLRPSQCLRWQLMTPLYILGVLKGERRYWLRFFPSILASVVSGAWDGFRLR